MPSKKTFAVLIVCFGAVLSLWLLQANFSSSAKAPVNVTKNTPVATLSESTTPALDSDHDGLPDWQEILIGTDPHNPDTDGDGTPDGQEVATGRDPLKKGPNDKVNTPTTILTSSQAKADATVNTGEGTLTDQLAKDYFGRYLSLQQNGQVTSDQAQQIALNTLASPQYTQATGVIYTKNNLRINTQTSADTFKTYSDTVNNIFLSRHPDHLGEEKTILQQAAETGNSTELNKLDPIIIAYRGLISDLLAVYVPADAVTIHLGLLNASSNVLQNIESMRVTFTDPVKSFAGVSQYDKHMSELAVALQNFQLYMDRKISTKP